MSDYVRQRLAEIRRQQGILPKPNSRWIELALVERRARARHRAEEARAGRVQDDRRVRS